MWLGKSIFMAIVYLIVILALIFAYDHTVLSLIFMPILGTKLDMSCWIPNNIFSQAIEVYFLLIVAMHFVQLRRSSDLNDENPNESAV